MARGNGLDRDAAEDVVQTVWLSLLQHVNHRLTEPRALRAWLISTARREAIRTRRGAGPLPETEFLRDERDRRLWAAFHRLPQRCQELVRVTVLIEASQYLPREASDRPCGAAWPGCAAFTTRSVHELRCARRGVAGPGGPAGRAPRPTAASPGRANPVAPRRGPVTPDSMVS